MVVSWTNGGPTNLIHNLEAAAEAVQAGAGEKLADVTLAAEADMKSIINDSTTPYGEKRVSEGRESAGRRESDDMYKAVSSNVVADGNSIEGRWGWIDGIEDYYFYQESGTEFIEPMNALHGSYTKAVEDLHGELAKLPGVVAGV